jgi:enoyl-CoA hydratase/carnithine racemase
MSGNPVRLEREGELAVVTFNHPPFNLWERELADSLAEVLTDLESDPARAVLFRAEGKVVSGGVNVEEFAAAGDPAGARVLFDQLMSFTTRMDDLPCPTVWASHALTLTWAMELALTCDLIVAADDCAWGLVEARIGLTPTMGGSQRLAARAGDARAREFVMFGEPTPAKTLFEWGVINRLVPKELVDETARELAKRLAEGPTRAHEVTKKVLNAARDNGVAAADELVVRLAADLFGTEDLQGGVKSFLEEGFGKATFEGR